MSCMACAGSVQQHVNAACSGESGSPGGSDNAERCDAANSVSLLQEYIQRCSAFSPHKKILTWGFEQEIENSLQSRCLRFRATVAFVFNDVPHHFSGSWQTSKKKAQRDTAERVRRSFARTFESANEGGILKFPIAPSMLPQDLLQEFCTATSAGCETSDANHVQWKLERVQEGGERFRATVTFCIRGCHHGFRGGWSNSASSARRDTAERVLWYFGQAEEAFIAPSTPADQDTVVSPCTLTRFNTQSPTGGETDSGTAFFNGCEETTSEVQHQPEEDRTILMRVQNSLQKAFAQETCPGNRVWLWSYTQDCRDPQFFRAHVEVPSWNRSFQGNWCRGKKQAQRSACLVLKQHLDQMLA